MIKRILQSVNGNNNIIKGTDDQQNIFLFLFLQIFHILV